MRSASHTSATAAKTSRLSCVLSWMAVVGAVVPLSWLMFIQEDNEYLLGLWSRGRVNAFINGWNAPDYTIHQAPGRGDVAMVFTNLEDTPGAARFASVAFIKSAYELYPRRVVTMWDHTEPGISGNPYLSFHPSIVWLEQHQIGAVFNYTMDRDHIWKIEPMEIPPSVRPTAPITTEPR